MNNIALVDTMYLCHRARYSTGCADMEYEGRPTGVAFGVLQELSVIKELLNPDQFIFAFDGHSSNRRELMPTYKESRRNRVLDEDQAADDTSFYKQVERLHKEILPSLGYNSIFSVDGFEADDVIAQIALDIEPDDMAFIVSADEDFFQCLSANVRIYIPKKTTKPFKVWTEELFRTSYGIDPKQWAMVKALAGCKSDDVAGVKGVGEKTAVRWMKGLLKSESAANTRIKAGLESGILEKNTPIVTLPMEGTPGFVPAEDEATKDKEVAVYVALGFNSQRKATADKPPEAQRFF